MNIETCCFRYVLTGKRANGTAHSAFSSNKTGIKPMSCFLKDDAYEVKPPTVSQKSIEIYQNYVALGKYGPKTPKRADIAMYAKYASLK